MRPSPSRWRAATSCSTCSWWPRSWPPDGYVASAAARWTKRTRVHVSARRIPVGTIGERMFDARRYLGEGSPLEGSLAGFRVRGEQLALADAVAACLSGDGHLIAEAGTGVGKSLAYLVPAAF